MIHNMSQVTSIFVISQKSKIFLIGNQVIYAVEPK